MLMTSKNSLVLLQKIGFRYSWHLTIHPLSWPTTKWSWLKWNHLLLISHYLELMVKPFFVKLLSIALFSSSKSSYKVRKFFTNVSLLNNYPYYRFFLLSSLWVRRFFALTISLTLPYLPYRAKRFFVSKKYWFSSFFSCRIWRFFT